MKKLLLLLALCTVCSGCAIFKVGDLPQAHLIPACPNTPKPDISYRLCVKCDMGSERDYPPKAQTKANTKLGKLLKETGHFRQVSPYNRSADIHLNMQMVERSSPLAMIGSFITGYSFGAIPSWTTIHYELTTTAKGDNTSKTYRTEDTARMFMWLPLVVVSPFYNISTITDMEENMYLTAVQKMQRDGLLIKQEETAPAAVAEPVSERVKNPTAKNEDSSPTS